MPANLKLSQQQSGSALILAVLVAAIVAVMGTELAQDFLLSYKRVENRLLDRQAQLYLLAAEEIAVAALSSDAAAGASDSLLEAWAQPLPPLPTDAGFVQVQIQDAQGRFNLNSLAQRSAALGELGLPLQQRFTQQQMAFIRLLQELEEPRLAEAEAVALTEALIDWVDADDASTGVGGAESLYYVNEVPAYGPANQPFRSTGELQLLRHVTPQLYQQLLPHVTVLPEATTVNLNTAAPAVLSVLLPPGSAHAGQLQHVLRRQQTQPYLSMEDIAADPALAALAASGATQRPFAAASRYFLVQARVQQAGVERSLQSLLYRGDDGVRILSRHFGLPLAAPPLFDGPDGPGT